MGAYILRRVLLMLPTLLLSTVLVFSIMHFVPGNALIAKIGGSGTISPEQLATFKKEYGLDQPLPVQYLKWLRGIVTGNLGHSIYTGELISTSLARTIPVTFQLALAASVLATVLGLLFGLSSAILRRSPLDGLIRLVSIIGLSAPAFWVGTMAVIYFARWFHWQPATGRHVIYEDPRGTLAQLWMPATILGYAGAAVTARLTRSAALEVSREDHVRTARAKGLAGAPVWAHHILRNALLPVITVIGGQVVALLGGSVIVETIFAMPGLGRLLIDALNFRDYPMVQVIILLFAALVLVVNLAVDLLYLRIDPRVRYT